MFKIDKLREFLPKKHTIVNKLNNVVESVYDVVTVEPIPWNPRASGLPLCIPYELYNFLNKKTKEIDYPFSFYTRVGTAIHDALQYNFPKSKHGSKVFGNWRCSRHKDDKNPCDYTKNRSTLPGKRCPKCKKGELLYEELNLSYKSKKDPNAAITGHCDLVSCFNGANGKNYVVWEFKSTSDWNVNNPNKFLPYDKHLFQAWSYAVMLTDMGLRPKYIAIGYFSRDKARKGVGSNKTTDGIRVHSSRKEAVISHVVYFKVTDKRLKLARDILDYTVDQVYLANNVMSNDENSVKSLKKIHADRPCHTESDYNGYMKHHWFSNEKCPFAKPGRLGGCFTSDAVTGLFKKTKKLLEQT